MILIHKSISCISPTPPSFISSQIFFQVRGILGYPSLTRQRVSISPLSSSTQKRRRRRDIMHTLYDAPYSLLAFSIRLMVLEVSLHCNCTMICVNSHMGYGYLCRDRSRVCTQRRIQGERGYVWSSDTIQQNMIAMYNSIRRRMKGENLIITTS